MIWSLSLGGIGGHEWVEPRLVSVKMPPRTCQFCEKSRAIIRRPKTGDHVCKECFFNVFETEVHNTITHAKLFKPGDRVAIGASGGKGLDISLMLQSCS